MQHVSATFRKNSINNRVEAELSKKEVVLFEPEKNAPAATTNASHNAKPPIDGPPELKGLSIINQGHLTLHYHSYNEVSSLAPQPATAGRKRALEKSEDEEYSEALHSLMDINLSHRNLADPPGTSKRQRLEEPEPEVVEPEAQVEQEQAKQDEEPAQEKKKKGLWCELCGNKFNGYENKGSKQPCKFHPGMSTTDDHFTPHVNGCRREDSENGSADHVVQFKELSRTTLRG